MTHHGTHAVAPSAAMETLARGIGWFAIGLGTLELLAPRAVARPLGLRKYENAIRLAGAREITTGIGLLCARPSQRSAWLWGRVGGDAMDLALLGAGLGHWDPDRRRNAALAAAGVLSVAALDALCAVSLRQPAEAKPARDLSRRSGFPRPPAAMRGAAADAELPRDMLTPEPLRPWRNGAPAHEDPHAARDRHRLSVFDAVPTTSGGVGARANA